jgi:chromate transport protein ChrA
MLRQLLAGAAAGGCNIAIHALVMVAVIRVTHRADELATAYQTLRLIAVMIAAVTVLMIAHLAEIMVWVLTYAILGVTPRRLRPRLFLCELHDARLWRRDAGQALEFAWADDRDERRSVVRLVHCGDF